MLTNYSQLLKSCAMGLIIRRLPYLNIRNLKAALEVAKQDSSTPYEDVNQATNDVLVVLDQIIPIADQLQSYYVERRYEKDNYKGSE